MIFSYQTFDLEEIWDPTVSVVGSIYAFLSKVIFEATGVAVSSKRTMPMYDWLKSFRFQYIFGE